MNTPPHTKEPQYGTCLEIDREVGRTRLGLMTNQVWHDDPRRLGFVLARYKFVAKMLSGSERVLEIGCADAFGTRIVQQEVKEVVVTDFDPVFIADVHERMSPRWPVTAVVHDLLAGPFPGAGFDGAYAVDVLEHIPPTQEDVFIANMIAPLKTHGVCLIGSPSIQSQAYASPPSKAGHVNCKSGPELKATLQRHFHNVFLFSMNDEVVHTGYHAMAHYLWALGVGKK
jgi:2-polyprenyl-3-methyl-5-hydroxy-6-metoxy-1,4-benzoquinol methylase